MGCLATVLGAVEEGNTANRGGCIQHVSGCVSTARLSHHTLSSNESHLLSWKMSTVFLGMQKNMHSFAHGHSLIPQHDRLHICWLCVFNTVLHLFHHPGTCSFSCIRFCICMQISYFPTSTLGSDTVIVLQFGLKEKKCEKTTCLLPGVGFIFSITHSNLLAA